MRLVKIPTWFYCWVAVSCVQAEVPFVGERYGLFTIPEFRSRFGKEVPTLQIWFPEDDELHIRVLRSDDVSQLRQQQVGSDVDGVCWSVSPLGPEKRQAAEALAESSGFRLEKDVQIPLAEVPDVLARFVRV